MYEDQHTGPANPLTPLLPSDNSSGFLFCELLNLLNLIKKNLVSPSSALYNIKEGCSTLRATTRNVSFRNSATFLFGIYLSVFNLGKIGLLFILTAIIVVSSHLFAFTQTKPLGGTYKGEDDKAIGTAVQNNRNLDDLGDLFSYFLIELLLISAFYCCCCLVRFCSSKMPRNESLPSLMFGWSQQVQRDAPYSTVNATLDDFILPRYETYSEEESSLAKDSDATGTDSERLFT